MGRRAYLKGVGAMFGTAIAVAGGARAARTTVDIVEAGADPTGTERIDAILDREAGDGRVLVFPDGTYRMGDTTIDADGFGMVAATGASPTIRPAGPTDSKFLTIRGSDIELRGFRFDFRHSGHGGRIEMRAGDGLRCRDLTVLGTYPEGTDGFRFDVRGSGGSGLVENVVARGGQVDGADGFGMYVGREHAGVLTIRDCEIEGFPNNGLYGSDPGYPGGGMGEVHVEGGLYKNNNIANVRIGSPGSYVDGATVVVDDAPPYAPRGENARGIRLDETGGLTVRNCTIRMSHPGTHSDGALVLSSDAGACAVYDTHIAVDNGRYGIRAKPGGSGRLRFEGVSLTGSDAGRYPIELGGREATFTNCCTTFETPHLTRSDACPLLNDPPEDLPNTLTISSPDRVSYEFTVDGHLAKSTANGATIDDGDSISGSRATGQVWGGSDSYTFSGTLLEFTKRGTATVTVNGEQLAFEAPSNDRHTLTIASDGPKVNYRFAVSGRLHKSGANGATFDRSDRISGSRATGRVWGGRDSYTFTGDVRRFSADGPVTVILDGETVDPERL